MPNDKLGQPKVSYYEHELMNCVIDHFKHLLILKIVH